MICLCIFLKIKSYINDNLGWISCFKECYCYCWVKINKFIFFNELINLLLCDIYKSYIMNILLLYVIILL